MSKRRRGRGNARARLQKQLEIQRDLERELERLNKGQDHIKCAKEIIDFVQKYGEDPMMSIENPFLVRQSGTCSCCTIL